MKEIPPLDLSKAGTDMIHPPQYTKQRFIGTIPDERFWGMVKLCYNMSRRKYNYFCLKMLHACKKYGSSTLHSHHAIPLYHALQADVKFFELPQSRDAILKAFEAQWQQNNANVFTFCEKFLFNSFQETIANKMDASEAINKQHKVFSPTTVMKALEAYLGDIDVSHASTASYDIKLFMKGPVNYAALVQTIKKQEIDGKFGAEYYNSFIGQALHFQWENRDRTEAFDPVVNRYLRLLFYSDFNGVFKKYLHRFRTEDAGIYNDVGAAFFGFDQGVHFPKGIGAHHVIKIAQEDYKTQLKLITDIVVTWDSFKALQGHRPPQQPPIQRKSIKGNGGGSGSG
jgi:hypothetical protein